MHTPEKESKTFRVRLAFSRGPRGSSAEYDTTYFSLGENSMSRTCTEWDDTEKVACKHWATGHA